MDGVPIFTLTELIVAFAQILPHEEADRRAREWFETFGAGSVDSAGYYLYEQPSRAAVVVAQRGPDSTPGSTGGFERFRGASVEEKVDYLMRFSDFHLNLVSLASPAASARIQRVRGDSDERAARRRAQMLRIVQIMRE